MPNTAPQSRKHYVLLLSLIILGAAYGLAWLVSCHSDAPDRTAIFLAATFCGLLLSLFPIGIAYGQQKDKFWM